MFGYQSIKKDKKHKCTDNSNIPKIRNSSNADVDKRDDGGVEVFGISDGRPGRSLLQALSWGGPHGACRPEDWWLG